MAFGQSAGPPATSRQVGELLELFAPRGTTASGMPGPMGFTQRQAAGKFTRDEADELIERLQSATEAAPEAPSEPARRPSKTEQLLRGSPRSSSPASCSAEVGSSSNPEGSGPSPPEPSAGAMS